MPKNHNTKLRKVLTRPSSKQGSIPPLWIGHLNCWQHAKKIFFSILGLIGVQYCQSLISNREYIKTDVSSEESYHKVEFIPYKNPTRTEMKSLRHPDPLDQMPTGSLKPSGKRGEKIDSTVKSRLVDRAAEDTEDAKDVADKARDGLAQMKWICYLLAFVLLVLTILVLVVLALLSYFIS